MRLNNLIQCLFFGESKDFIRTVLENRAFVEWAINNRSRLVEFEQSPEELSFVESTKSHRQLIATLLSQEVEREQKFDAFRREFNEFSRRQEQSGQRIPCEWEDRFPCLDDKSSTTLFDRHYTYHPAWAARILAKNRPSKHIDISSTINFSTLVSAFVPTEFYDYRPAKINLPQLHCGAADLCALPFADGSVASLSCMHVLEHIGLGRYGDALDPDGDLKAVAELIRVLAPGGDLLIAVPVGKARVQFNAHRVYDAMEFVSYFQGATLVERALIEESGEGGIVSSPSDEQFRAQAYGCGCFWFRKN